MRVSGSTRDHSAGLRGSSQAPPELPMAKRTASVKPPRGSGIGASLTRRRPSAAFAGVSRVLRRG